MKHFILGLLLWMATAILPSVARADAVPSATALVNSFRASHGRAPVVASAHLVKIAHTHGRDMQVNQFFSHTGSDGSRVSGRAKRAGYKFCVIAENIASGQRTTQQVMGDWINSPSHRANLLRADVNELGVVRLPGDIWVMVLGRKNC